MAPAMRPSMRISTLDLRPMEARMRPELTIDNKWLFCNYLQDFSRTDDPFHAMVPASIAYGQVHEKQKTCGRTFWTASGPRDLFHVFPDRLRTVSGPRNPSAFGPRFHAGHRRAFRAHARKLPAL
jgi:hypothetical protein